MSSLDAPEVWRLAAHEVERRLACSGCRCTACRAGSCDFHRRPVRHDTCRRALQLVQVFRQRAAESSAALTTNTNK